MRRQRGDGPFQIHFSLEMLVGLIIGVVMGYLIFHTEAVLQSAEHLLRLVA